jgi:hypothetical protein
VRRRARGGGRCSWRWRTGSSSKGDLHGEGAGYAGARGKGAAVLGLRRRGRIEAWAAVLQENREEAAMQGCA